MIYTDAKVTVPVGYWGLETAYDYLICSFCDEPVDTEIIVCGGCGEYKGIVTRERWEEMFGESWD